MRATHIPTRVKHKEADFKGYYKSGKNKLLFPPQQNTELSTFPTKTGEGKQLVGVLLIRI